MVSWYIALGAAVIWVGVTLMYLRGPIRRARAERRRQRADLEAARARQEHKG